MAFRVTPLMAIASSTQPQPAFGSWVTAGAGLAAPSNVPINITLGTACASGNDATQLFTAGEECWLINPDGTHAESVRIYKIPANSNTLTLGPQTNVLSGGQQNPVTQYSHAVGAIGTGAFILPKQMSNNLLVVYEDAGVGPWLYIGQSCLFTTTFLRLFKIAAVNSGVQPGFWNAGMFSPGNPFDLSEIFVRGTAADNFTTSICVD